MAFGLAWICTGFACAVLTVVSLQAQPSCYVQKALYHPSLLAYFNSSPAMIPEPWEEGVWCRYSTQKRVFCSLLFLAFGQLWVSLLITICCKKTFLWQRLRDALIFGCNDKPLEADLILCLLRKIVVFGSSLQFMICLVIGSQPGNGAKCVFNHMKQDLNQAESSWLFP